MRPSRFIGDLMGASQGPGGHRDRGRLFAGPLVSVVLRRNARALPARRARDAHRGDELGSRRSAVRRVLVCVYLVCTDLGLGDLEASWDLYDYELASWPRVKQTGLAAGMAVSPRFRRLLERDWELVRAGWGTWDHQWQYAVMRHHGLSVSPATNMLVNIGHRGDGTQLQGRDRILSSSSSRRWTSHCGIHLRSVVTPRSRPSRAGLLAKARMARTDLPVPDQRAGEEGHPPSGPTALLDGCRLDLSRPQAEPHASLRRWTMRRAPRDYTEQTHGSPYSIIATRTSVGSRK